MNVSKRNKFKTVFLFFFIISSQVYSSDKICKLQSESVPYKQQEETSNWIDVIFISNCGFVLKIGKEKVLFDIESPEKAFSREEILKAYSLLNKNQPPFDNIKAVFISHPHPDHLGIKELYQYLLQNEESLIFSTNDTKVELINYDSASFNKITKRFTAVESNEDYILEKSVEGISIEFLTMYHAGAPNYVLKDLSFVLTIGGKSFFYLSDVDPGYEKNLEIIQKWSKRNHYIDLLFTPDINLYTNEWSPNGYKVIKEYIKPAMIVPMHLNPALIDDAEKKIKENFSNFYIFRKPAENRIFK